MNKVTVQKALNLSRQYDRIWHYSTSKKNKELWKKRGYVYEGSWKCFSFHFGFCFVRAWSKGEVFLLEANFYDRTDWYVWKNNNWWRFKTKCEAEGYVKN